MSASMFVSRVVVIHDPCLDLNVRFQVFHWAVCMAGSASHALVESHQF